MSEIRLGKRAILAATTLLFFSAGPVLHADTLPVSVSYTVSGGPGAWLLDFGLLNEIPGTSGTGLWPVNYFGIDLPNAAIAGNPSPPCFIDDPPNPFICGTDYIWLPWNYFSTQQGTPPSPSPFPAYNDLWFDIGPTNFFQSRIGAPYPVPGSSLSGFKVLDTDVNAPASVNCVAQAYNFYQPNGVLYSGGGNLQPDVPTPLPVFQGTATAPASAIPEPAPSITIAIMFAGLLIWRHKRRAT
ncbi:MAG TPA: hypothetical protein VKB79_30570 [Bryobacteraceae bacterium]|nr:hypothetical protein [Bryobacteraceae bacterium]